MPLTTTATSPLTREVYFTGDGDLYFDPDGSGDLYIATGDELLSSLINKRLTSTEGDWASIPDLGANLVDFVGLPNTRETASYIQTRVQNILVQDGLVAGGDISVEVIPVGPNEILCILLIRSLERDTNEPIVTIFSFDMRDNKMVPRIINV